MLASPDATTPTEPLAGAPVTPDRRPPDRRSPREEDKPMLNHELDDANGILFLSLDRRPDGGTH